MSQACMKYICTKNEEGKEEIFTFPKSIDHDAYMEALEDIRNKTYGNWKRVFREPVSAGFVTRRGLCFGRSETLDLDSRTGDTALLLGQYI